MTLADSTIHSQITAVILAGGQGRRMDCKDKGLVTFFNKPLIQHVIEKLRPQVEHIIINANRNNADYEVFGYPVIPDAMHNFQGPLAGFMAAMRTVTTKYIVCVPCDGPMLSEELVNRLAARLLEKNADIAVAHDGNRLQPVYVLISTHLKQSLEQYLQSGERKIDRWYAKHKVIIVDFSDSSDTFININTHQERDVLQSKSSVA
jgi:molybdopterin-guanine dinucleotide biosynthesis protein A